MNPFYVTPWLSLETPVPQFDEDEVWLAQWMKRNPIPEEQADAPHREEGYARDLDHPQAERSTSGAAGIGAV